MSKKNLSMKTAMLLLVCCFLSWFSLVIVFFEIQPESLFEKTLGALTITFPLMIGIIIIWRDKGEAE